MNQPPSHDITQLLEDWRRGDAEAQGKLMPLIYGELRELAERALRGERPDHTLQATALVHEAYLKLIDQSRASWHHRTQFLAVAAQVMRRILVDHARGKQAAKRGGKRERVPLDNVTVETGQRDPDVMALDEALTRLAALDPQQGKIVELRFFGGLTVEETAEALDISPATVKRDWTVAKAWLHREMKKGSDPS